MNSMRVAVAAMAILGVSGCGHRIITQEVNPVKQISDDEVCIIDNPKVKAGFLREFRETLERNGYKAKILPANATLNDCPVTSIYLAHWTWDLAIYMSYAKINVYEAGRPIGDVVYDAREGGNRIFDKFVKGDEKVRELVNLLFPRR